jgi:hypothetical protein
MNQPPRFVAYFPRALSGKEVMDFLYPQRSEESMNRDVCEHGNPEADGACKECYLLQSQNTELDRVLVEMEHALNEADAIMEEVDEETSGPWRKRWGRLWGRTV